MPGVSRLSVDAAVRECRELDAAGVKAVLLFGIPDFKDAVATSSNYDPNGVVQRAATLIESATANAGDRRPVQCCSTPITVTAGSSVPTATSTTTRRVELLMKTALTYARAGVDCVAPSDMMDGRVGAIRGALDREGFIKTTIMSYAAKYASGFYGPFREAADSTPSFGDRRTYQMDPANGREALREVALDIAEGADIVMVKPALAYMDLIRRVRDTFDVPVATYNVSGEYAMVKAAAERGWIDEERIVDEMLTGFARAGADIIITYFAKDYLRRHA